MTRRARHLPNEPAPQRAAAGSGRRARGRTDAPAASASRTNWRVSLGCYHSGMPDPGGPDLADLIGGTIRSVRVGLHWSERELARRLETSQRAIQRLESGRLTRIDADLETQAMRLLGIRISVDANVPALAGRSEQRDIVHGWCASYLTRVLRRRGWEVRGEVEVGQGRFRGWVDLLAFRPLDGTLVVIEIKTRIDDLGRIVRTVGWYTRSAPDAALRLGWRPRRIVRLLAVLASADTETRLELQHHLIRAEFPASSAAVAAWIEDPEAPAIGSAVVLIDPGTRRQRWIVPRRSEGRRTPPP